ncbi:MAG: hypothetical protein VYC39_07075 [Myxococcota bacterium]|nr:hypothetical protein [Myxococcota bacterium]
MSENEFFNLKKLRKNWVEENDDGSALRHAKLQAVKPTLDPHIESARILKELDEQCKIRFPMHYESLSVFLAEAKTAFEQVFAEKPASEDIDEDDLDSEDSLDEDDEAFLAMDDDEDEELEEEGIDEDVLSRLRENLILLEDLLEAVAL